MSIEKPRKVIKKPIRKTPESFGGILSNHLDPKPSYPQTIIVNISPYKTLRTNFQKPLKVYISH
jgi:hypothetical protein